MTPEQECDDAYRHWLARQRALDDRPEMTDRVMRAIAIDESNRWPDKPRPVGSTDFGPRLVDRFRRAAESRWGRPALITAASLVCVLRLATFISLFVVW